MLSSFAFNFNLRPCSKSWDKSKKASECQDDDLMAGTGNATLLWDKAGGFLRTPHSTDVECPPHPASV